MVGARVQRQRKLPHDERPPPRAEHGIQRLQRSAYSGRAVRVDAARVPLCAARLPLGLSTLDACRTAGAACRAARRRASSVKGFG